MSTYGSSKSNVMGVVKEVTAGTPVDPSGVSDYVALQPDLSLVPNFQLLENEEIRSSIGASKSIQGLESPESSFSHYLKHSGVEGQAPEINDLLESAFGSTSTNGTERSTTTSSTVSLLKLAAGGSDFARGKAVLIKDGTNGYSIRPVLSVSTNDLTLGFNLADAPASGVAVGKCINFAPANTGHPSLSLHSYRGNGQLYELLAGARVNSLGITAAAGEFINATFGLQGTKYHFNPIRIDANDTKLDFEDSAAAALVATVDAGVYRDPHELAQAIEDSMNAQGSADTFTVEYMDNDSTSGGKFKFTSDGTVFKLEWNTGTNTANTIGDAIGFSTAADDTGALTYTADNAMSWAAPHTPTFDSSDPLVAKANEVMIGDSTDYVCFCASSIQFSLENTLTDVLCVCAESGVEQKLTTARAVTVQITALLDKHDADKFRRYRANSDTAFSWNFGVKSGGNWVAGKCGNLYMPSCVVSAFEVTDLDSQIGLNMTLQGFVDASGNGEVYLNFL
jgi:hypothetical protein